MKARVLVVDDEQSIRETVRYQLEKDEFTARTASDGKEALEVFAEFMPEVVVLDVMMPELDGIEVCRRLRARGSEVGIIFLSSRDEDVDVIVGLKVGGDDYVRKPFSPRELSARVGNLAARLANSKQPLEETGPVMRRGDLVMNTETGRVTFAGQPIELTAAEHGYLKVFLKAPSDVLITAGKLGQEAYGDLTHQASKETVEKHISNLRRRFAKVFPFLKKSPLITNERGMGYRLSDCKGPER